MAKGRSAKAGGESKIKKRKPRVGFTVQKDVLLLREALKQNPWQFGDDKWKTILETISSEFQSQLTVRTIRGRVALLLEKYNTQQLETTTGEEEEATERGNLLSEISTIIEEEKTAINLKFGADEGNDSATSDSDLFTVSEVRDAKKKVAESRKSERVQAVLERDKLLDSEPPAHVSRKKRPRLTLEDDMIVKRQDHEMAMDLEKLGLERERLEVERRREVRLEDEGKRRDQLSETQLEIQRQMLQMMNKFLEK